MSDNNNIIPVILSGGSGTRLWPLSRKGYPKQFLPLTHPELSMLQDTVQRVGHLAAPIVVSNEDHRFLVAEQLHEILDKNTKADIILEPVGKNTAPAIALAALSARQRGGDPILVVLPADHMINNLDDFKQALETAVRSAENDQLTTFGIVPTEPETGYGYIKAKGADKDGAIEIDEFVEKPDLEKAESYLQSGDYFWNSGMFVFKSSVYLETLGKNNAEMLRCCEQAFEKAITDLDFIRVDKTSFEQSPEDSIDYAVMENAENATMVPLDAGWSDLGSWSSIWEVRDKDSKGNIIIGDVIQEDCENCFFQSDDHLIAAIGVDDLIIVDTKDALLISRKDRVQEVKKIVDKIKAADRSEHLLHRKVYRPWGSYEGIGEGSRYQVKRIIVNSGASLSLQMHHQRAEHWIVVVGTAKVQRDEDILMVSENESIYIPLGAKHRLTNEGTEPLELIEVQSGDYLGEDDIVRFEDNYGRSDNK